MIALTLALRNLWLNRRRSLATILAVAVGFTAINLFGGYIHDVYRGLKSSAIHGEGLGHLTVARNGFFAEGALHPERYSLKGDELKRLLNTLESTPGVKLATPRIGLSGLISNGRISTIFIGEGQVPQDMAELGQPHKLDPKHPVGGLMSSGLGQLLGVKPGQTTVIMGSTLAGQTNALDFEVDGFFDTGNAGTNDKSLILPLGYAQQLLDTQGASRVVVLLNDENADAAAVRATLLPRLKAAGFDVEIRTWVEQSAFYQQVKNLFDLIFMFLFSIVFVVVLMSIINTLTMSVMERVREIGTLRALGYQRGGILSLFAAEGLVLGAVGAGIGGGITVTIAVLINSAGVSYVPPSSSSPVPLTVGLVPGSLFTILCLLALVSMLAALVPARRAAKIEIVDALGHV